MSAISSRATSTFCSLPAVACARSAAWRCPATPLRCAAARRSGSAPPRGEDRGGELGEVAAGEVMAGDARRRCRGEIAVAVADQKTRRAIDRPAAQEVEDHAGLRLAPVAVL